MIRMLVSHKNKIKIEGTMIEIGIGTVTIDSMKKIEKSMMTTIITVKRSRKSIIGMMIMITEMTTAKKIKIETETTTMASGEVGRIMIMMTKIGAIKKTNIE